MWIDTREERIEKRTNAVLNRRGKDLSPEWKGLRKNRRIEKEGGEKGLSSRDGICVLFSPAFDFRFDVLKAGLYADWLPVNNRRALLMEPSGEWMAWNTLLVAILTFATDNRRQKYSSSNYLALLTLRVYLKRRFIKLYIGRIYSFILCVKFYTFIRNAIRKIYIGYQRLKVGHWDDCVNVVQMLDLKNKFKYSKCVDS